MSSDEDFPDWIKRRRRYWPFREFEDIEGMFKEMEKMMTEEFKEFTSRIPREYVKERQLPDGKKVREWGPFVYGYQVKIGPDGKPEIREFGNVQPTRYGAQIKEEREPLVDVVNKNGELQIVAELPGVEKKDIKLYGTEDTLTISVDIPDRKYYKEIKLPAKIDPKNVKSTYKNGVLEVTLKKVEKEKKPKGEPIEIG